MNEITRYELNEYGELPLSNGRYVRWEEGRNKKISNNSYQRRRLTQQKTSTTGKLRN